MDLQKEIDALAPGAILALPPGEYEGPVVLARPVELQGRFSTIWAVKGPVLNIQSPGVVLKNLRIEVTGEQRAAVPSVALAVSEGCQPLADKVELQGTVVGMKDEAGSWELPAVVDLGTLPVNTQSRRQFLISVPVACKLESDITGLGFAADHLSPGPNTMEIIMEPMLKNTVIWGSIFIISRNFVRRLSVTGQVGADANTDELGRYTSQVSWQSSELLSSRNLLESIPRVGEIVQKGQRVDISRFIKPGVPLIAAMGWDSEMPFDIDASVFVLDEKERVHRDEDLVYYNQPVYPAGGLRLLGSGDPDLERVEMDYGSLPDDCQRISFCLSIYEFEKNLQTFSSVRGLYIRLIDGSSGHELIRYIPDKIFSLETAVVMAHIYRYKGQWRFASVGAGFKDGLAGLCRQYGIETE